MDLAGEGDDGMRQLDGITDQTDMSLSKFQGLVMDKAMVFPVVMYGCESWNVKKSEW